MSEVKHTPGPWKAHKGWADAWMDNPETLKKHPNWCEITLDGEPNGRPFFSISGHFGMANARLIAAAPDLLEALKEARSTIASVTTRIHMTEGDVPMFPKMLAMIDAAISRAEGSE